jgi:hypothetical protein
VAEQQRRQWESRVEALLREARERGDFDGLPGAGQPLPGVTDPYDELWWARSLLAREKLSYLPPALQLKRDVERGLERLWKLRTEEDVRAAVEALNERIWKANSRPLSGPPSTVAPLDPERIVSRWREAKGAS